MNESRGTALLEHTSRGDARARVRCCDPGDREVGSGACPDLGHDDDVRRDDLLDHGNDLLDHGNDLDTDHGNDLDTDHDLVDLDTDHDLVDLDPYVDPDLDPDLDLDPNPDLDPNQDPDRDWWTLVSQASDAEASLEELGACTPCPWSIAELTRINPRSLGTDDAVLYLQALQRHSSWLAALESRALVAAAGPVARHREVQVLDRVGDRERSVTLVDEVRDEIAAALHRSPSAVHEQIEQARLLDGPLLRTRAALESGEIAPAQSRMLAQQALRITGRLVVTSQEPLRDSTAECQQRAAFLAACEGLQDRVLPRASTGTPGQVRALAARAVARLDAAGEEQRRRLAAAQVDVRLYPEEDGLAVILARMDALDAARVYAAIASTADVDDSSDRTAGQRRAQALVRLTCGTGQPDGDAVEARPEVQAVIEVLVDLPTLLGLQDNPGQLVGPGSAEPQPVTMQAIRELLDDPTVAATLRRLVVDPLSGALLDRGRSTYQVPRALRDFLTTRDLTCRFPGCSRRAARCQIDHALPWDDGGTTDRANLGSLCVRHHQLKTHGDWRIVASGEDGACMWLSPGGRRHEHRTPALTPWPAVPRREQLALVDPDPPPF